jgi:uncharacterized protein YegJ (DUF2314 family)
MAGRRLAMRGADGENERKRRERGSRMKTSRSDRSIGHESPRARTHGSQRERRLWNMGRRFLLAVAGLMIVAMSAGLLHAQSRADRTKTDDPAVPKVDPAMERAFSKARASLDPFLELARNPPLHLRGFALKVGIEEGPDMVEYFWIYAFTQSGDSFSGKINNRPRLVKRVRAGRVYQFQRADIVDWTYIDMETRRIHGNFTACALLTRKPPDLAAELRQKFGLDCEI